MITEDKRIRIITGHYGSGKTEFAVNYATTLVRLSDRKVAFADMDIVNVYFRSRQMRDKMSDLGIYMMDSSINTYVEVPSIPAEMVVPFIDKSFDYVIDLGGNDVGTIVLGRYKEKIDPTETDFFMAVNVFRPDTASVERIIKEKEKIERSSGLLITGFINNSNLVRDTSAKDIIYGDRILKEVSKITTVPIKYTAYVEEVVTDLTSEIKKEFSGEIIPLKYFMREKWM